VRRRRSSECPLIQMSLALKLGFNTRETNPPDQKSS